MGKILIVEQIAPAGIEILQAGGHDVDVRLDLDEKGIAKAIEKAEALIVRSATKVDENLLEAAENLKVVGRAGVGIDNVDVDAATDRGIMVVNTPEANILSAAEHTMGLILAQARNIPQAHQNLKEGTWNRGEFSGVELSGKVLGIVGLGRVGQLVGQRARAFGMEIVAHDPYVSKERAAMMGVKLLGLKELMSAADFVSLHMVANEETREIINAEILALAKPGLRLVNVSRGEVIKETDLAEAIRTGKIAGAALDVFQQEPPRNEELLQLPQVVVTPHLGASTLEAQERVGTTVAEQVVMALAGEFPPFVVNVSADTVPEIFRPYLPLCEKLGRILAVLDGGDDVAASEINVNFFGEIGTVDAAAGILAVITGMLKAATDQPISYVNAQAIAKERGIKFNANSTSIATEYVNLVSVGSSDNLIAGTVVGLKNELRIVQINDHKIDVPPADHMILIDNDDRPGAIGLVGNILGNAKMNIDDMHVGKSNRGAALMVISTSQKADEATRKALEEAEGINAVRLIEL